MKKYITIPVLATVTLLLAIGIVVACTKENTNKEAATTEAPHSTKDLTLSQKLANGVYNVWQKSDSTYRANPTGFLSTCSVEDFETFYEMTNISQAQIDSIAEWADKMYDFSTGGTSMYAPLCLVCKTSLLNYGSNVVAMRDVINDLKLLNDPDTVPCFTPSSIDSCIILCHTTFGYGMNDEDAWCLLNCSLSKVFDRMSIHLAAVKADE